MISKFLINLLDSNYKKSVLFKSYEIQFKNLTDDEVKEAIKERKPTYIDEIINFLLDKETDYEKQLNLMGYESKGDFEDMVKGLKNKIKGELS